MASYFIQIYAIIEIEQRIQEITTHVAYEQAQDKRANENLQYSISEERKLHRGTMVELSFPLECM